jgi:ABC-type branched-subunit amino acid transport system substrate-binding protein
MFSLFLIASCLFLMNAGPCQRTVVRDGVRMAVDDAQRMDLARAETALTDGRYDEAVARYDYFLKEFPNSRYTALALVKTGEAYFKKGDLIKAQEYFNEVLERFPRAAEAADAAWGRALIAYDEKDCATVERVVLEYRDLSEDKRWDQMTLLLAECKKEVGATAGAFKYYGEECRGGRDQQMREKARAGAELAVKDVGDEPLKLLADEFADEFPGDLALLELIGRSVEADTVEEGKVFADLFVERFPESPYSPEFEELRFLLEQRLKVKPNRIGVMLPLSGPFSSVGEQALKGIMLATKVFDEVGAVFEPDLYVRDTGGQSPAEEIVEELVNESHVIAIVGPLRSSVSERAGVKAQELGVPLVVLSPGERLPMMGDMIYQNCLTKSQQAQALAEYAVLGMGIKTFGVLYPDDDYGGEFMRLFYEAVIERGGQVVAYQFYDKEATDFREEIKTLKKLKKLSKFEALFIPAAWRRVAMIAPQIRYYRLSGVKLLGMNGWHSRELLQLTQPEDLEGAVFTDGIAPEAGMPAFDSFSRRFQREFGKEPGIVQAQACETADLLLSVINRYRVRDRDQLKLALDHVQDYAGVLGPISIGPDGRWQKKIHLFMVSDGDFILLTD